MAAPRRSGVIDLGSNSVRLAVFDHRGRAPHEVFNERVQCGLGRDLAVTGRLNEAGAARALACLPRFAAIAGKMGVEDLVTLATAATREAVDGPEFLNQIRQRLSLTVRQLSAVDEAQLSALGVIAGIPEAEGLMGDLGGGSLEVAQVTGAEVGRKATLPLGVLRFATVKPSDWSAYIDARLSELDWLSTVHGCAFYPVGGAWRAVARAHIEYSNHPLHTIQQYEISAAALADFCKELHRAGTDSLKRTVSARRLATLPAAARVLDRLVSCIAADRVIFSALGLREGYHYDRLSAEDRAIDPLLAGCADFARRESRFEADGARLDAWLNPLFDDDDPQRRRLRRAACYLVDIAWHEHRDDRAIEAFHRASRLQVVGLDHHARTVLSLTMYHRYAGAVVDDRLDAVRVLVQADDRSWAMRVGLALRLAMTLCGGRFDLLTGTRLQNGDKRIDLELHGAATVLEGEVVLRRLKALATQFAKDAAFVVAGRVSGRKSVETTPGTSAS